MLQHGLPYNTDLHQDNIGDGVSLLMAYALNLDPSLNLQSSLPVPIRGVNDLRMTFHARSSGLTYSVETSTDLQNWTREGVTLSELDADDRRSASVERE